MYFKSHPRGFDEAWPCEKYKEDDRKLRALFEGLASSKGSSVKDFQKMAKEKLGVEFTNDETAWQLTDLWKNRRQGEMAGQVGAG